MRLIVFKLSKGFVIRLYFLIITLLTSATLFAETLVTPSTLLPAIGLLGKGDIARLVSDESPNWYKIEFKSQRAFVSKAGQS